MIFSHRSEAETTPNAPLATFHTPHTNYLILKEGGPSGLWFKLPWSLLSSPGLCPKGIFAIPFSHRLSPVSPQWPLPSLLILPIVLALPTPFLSFYVQTHWLKYPMDLWSCQPQIKPSSCPQNCILTPFDSSLYSLPNLASLVNFPPTSSNRTLHIHSDIIYFHTKLLFCW